MPASSDAPAPPWRAAWREALYGGAGFYRRQAPRDHFRTAVHASDHLARALLRLADRHGLTTVVDLGAGRAELLLALRALRPGLELLAVEVAPRPAELPADVGWASAPPERVEGLLVAHEWLDDVPCEVVEVDAAGAPRLVHVDPATGEEHLGPPVDDAAVEPEVGGWLRRWWPVHGAPPGTRAEVGAARDGAWRDAVDRLARGVAVAVDYGHTRSTRPAGGSLRSYRGGRQVAVVPDGSRDVTAGVAVDAVAAAVGGTVLRQREALAGLGVAARLPPREGAVADPAGYLRALADAAAAARVAGPGFGDFYWVVSGAGGTEPGLPASR